MRRQKNDDLERTREEEQGEGRDRCEQYTPGPAAGRGYERTGDKTAKRSGPILVRELRHSPEKVWRR